MDKFSTYKGEPVEPCHLLQFDGLSVPNPGKATSGAVLFRPDGTKLAEIGEYMSHGTNNTAEYMGLIIGLRMAVKNEIRALKIEGDSQLVIKQCLGQWAVNNLALKALHAEALVLFGEFDYVALRHVRREFNTLADSITNEVIKSEKSFVRYNGASENIVVPKALDSGILTILKNIDWKLDMLLEKIQ
jgi:ribonuclease HI